MTWIEQVVQPGRDEAGMEGELSCSAITNIIPGFDDWYIRPATQLEKIISCPVLWYWGHEHRMVVYKELSIDGGLTAFVRCAGHGGMPVELPSEPKHPECVVEFVDDRLYDSMKMMKTCGSA
jgi:hypothetical protein